MIEDVKCKRPAIFNDTIVLNTQNITNITKTLFQHGHMLLWQGPLHLDEDHVLSQQLNGMQKLSFHTAIVTTGFIIKVWKMQ